MPGIFISYRREDSPGHAGRVFDRVRARFGADVVFMDVTAIEAGVDFVDAIERAVGTCDVLLAVIGPQWSSSTDGTGHRRLDSPTDFVRIEIAGALKRDVRVVPVLVDGARLPAAADLPDILQPLLRRNAVELRDARWDADIDQLLASLERIVKPREEPLRLDAAAPRRLRWLAGLAVLAVSVGAATVLGAKACSPAPEPVNVTTTTPPAATPPSATTPSPATTTRATTPRATTPAAPAATATVPDVVGRLLPDARDILKRAGVDVARVLYRDDRSKAVDLVVVQLDARTSAGSPPAVALTAVARAAIVISHKPEDADLARRLLGALMSSPATAGLAMRTVETTAVRPDAAARVTYSDGDLAGTAADIAKDATAWLRQNAPERPALTTSVAPRVVSRTMVINLPVTGGTTTSSSAPLPDVRGLGYPEARRLLTSAGATVTAKWWDDEKRKPLEVFRQTTVPGQVPGTSVVVLDVVARATMVVEYVASDRAVVARFQRDLTPTILKLDMLSRLQPVKAARPGLAGQLIHGGAVPREAASIARFVSGWLTKELGHTVSIQPVADSKMSPRALLLGLPKF